MNPKEIDAAIERVEDVVGHNVDDKDILGLIARGVWEIARQLALANELAGRF